jgi:isopenicillin-N N-acyltransferase-like protein
MYIEATELRGEPYERGRAHGELLRQLVHGHLAAWLDSLAQAGLGEPHTYVREMLQETDFRSSISVHAPDLLEEVDGIADGAEVPRDLIFALQLLDEEWAYRQRRRGNSRLLEKCSSLAIVSNSGPTWIGQNMDLGGYTDGWQILMRIARNDVTPGALVFSTAGMIGLMGVNASGLGVCVNSLPQLPSSSEGTPVAFVVRRLMRCRDLSEAAAIVLSIPHATNQHYVIAQAGAALSFEACAAGVTEFRPADPTRLFHTNHPLTEVLGEPEPLASRENTVARLLSLQERLGKGEPDLAEVQDALSAFDDARHPVCRLKSPDNGLISFTTGSMISALRPGRVPTESWVSGGPPSLGGYSAFTLARDPINEESTR